MVHHATTLATAVGTVSEQSFLWPRGKRYEHGRLRATIPAAVSAAGFGVAQGQFSPGGGGARSNYNAARVRRHAMVTTRSRGAENCSREVSSISEIRFSRSRAAAGSVLCVIRSGISAAEQTRAPFRCVENLKAALIRLSALQRNGGSRGALPPSAVAVRPRPPPPPSLPTRLGTFSAGGSFP